MNVTYKRWAKTNKQERIDKRMYAPDESLAPTFSKMKQLFVMEDREAEKLLILQ